MIRPDPSRTPALAGLLLLLALGGTTGSGTAQDVLDRTPGLDGGEVGIPWTLHVNLPHRFHDIDHGDGVDVATTTTFIHTLGLPRSSVVRVAWAIQSPTVPGQSDEVQVAIRHRVLGEPDAFANLALTAAWNAAAGSLDAEAALARQLGPLRLLGAARWLSDARGAGEDRAILAAGAVWHPLPRRSPVSLAGDAAIPLERDENGDVAWSAGLQVGLPHTALTLALQATNTAAATLQGRSFPAEGTRYGFELALPVPVGFFLGTYPDREAAVRAVVEEADRAADVVVDIRRYAYGPGRMVVPAGTVVEWTNRDAVVHTATAEDDAWDSGAIPPGRSWRARFDEPGVYPYFCGPHPFMKGVVVVR